MDKSPLLLALNLRERERLTLLVLLEYPFVVASSPIVALRTPRGFVGEDEMKEIQPERKNSINNKQFELRKVSINVKRSMQGTCRLD